nr:hypothetical protein CFP56_41369 [Quercus suber]
MSGSRLLSPFHFCESCEEGKLQQARAWAAYHRGAALESPPRSLTSHLCSQIFEAGSLRDKADRFAYESTHRVPLTVSSGELVDGSCQ